MIRATDIHSLTEFTRNARLYIRRITDTKSPVAITVNGEAHVVVQDAKTYQTMVDALEHLTFIAGIRESEADEREGRVQDIDQAFIDIEANLGL